MKKILSESVRVLLIILKDNFYKKVALVGAVVFGGLNWWLLNQVTTISTFFQMAADGEYGPFSIPYAAVYWLLALAAILLFGLACALLVWQFKHSRAVKGLYSSSLGAFSGALGAACPVCGAFLLQLLGVAGGVAIFPLKGLEFNLLSVGLMAAATIVSTRQAARVLDGTCAVCEAPPPSRPKAAASQKIMTSFVIFALALNQLVISQAASALGVTSSSPGLFGGLFEAKIAAAATIIAPKLNPDGKTTSLVEQPTITEVPANPQSGDYLADAQAVMFPVGQPFYAPEDISFDDPINAQVKWGAMEKSIQLSGELADRYNQIINSFTCNYCCGSPTRVTVISRCGCAHAKAWRGMAKYLLANYGDQYSNEQMKGEMYRWTGLWYPQGVIADYMLATGHEDAFAHKPHGGAGADGRHGL